MKRCLSCFKEYDDTLHTCPYCGEPDILAPNEPIHLMPGTVLADRYVIGKSVGTGGFGIVYKAWDTKLETEIAVKEFFMSRLMTRAPGTRKVIVSRKSQEEFQYRKKRFLEEARTMAKFSSLKSTPSVYEFFEENGTAYIVMELLNGMELSKYLALHGGKVEPELAVMIVNEVGSALKALHKSGVIHCDVAPDNIFLSTGAELGVKLMDLGAAKIEDATTDVIDIVMKPGYSPAEQYDKTANLGQWTDIYALGATLYVLLTGVKPTESTNRKDNKDDLLPPSAINPDIPENLSNTVMKAMAIDIHMRFKSVDEFLQAINGERKVVPVETERRQRKTRRLTTVVIALAAVAVIAFFVMRNYQEKREEGFLKEAAIDVWFSVEEGSSEEAAMQFIADDFTANFPDVTINLRAIPEKEYISELEKAADNGTFPQLFESTDATENILQKAKPVNEILNSPQAKECLFLDQYHDYYPDNKRIPLGIEVPVAYIITAGSESCEYTDECFDELSDFGVAETLIAADEAHTDLIGSNFNNKFYLDSKAFYDEGGNKCAVLLSSTMELNTFRNAFVGYGKSQAYYNAPQVHAGFTYEWSLGEGNRDENAAAERFLTWMLGNAYQSALMITKNNEGQIPVNEICFHSKVESRYLAPIEDIFKQFVFN